MTWDDPVPIVSHFVVEFSVKAKYSSTESAMALLGNSTCLISIQHNPKVFHQDILPDKAMDVRRNT
jgi:hypothetical protein